MKKFLNLSFVLSMLTAVVVAGCGGSDEQTTNQPGGPAPQVVQAGVMPIGCYNNNAYGYGNGYNGYPSNGYGSNTCSPCPAGYNQSGNQCIPPVGGAATNCPVGSIWNAQYNSCVPSGMNPGNNGCFTGSSWSQSQTGCIYPGQTQPNYSGYYCVPYYTGYVCYYTGYNVNANNCTSYLYYWNGRGYVRRSCY